jgi:hypothetical protein
MEDLHEKLAQSQAGAVAALATICSALVKSQAITLEDLISKFEETSQLLMQAGADPLCHASIDGIPTHLRGIATKRGASPASN